MVALSLVTAPANDILTLSEVKTHLRVDGSDEDTLISNLIDAATSYIDGYTGVLGRCLITQTWDWKLDSFPDSNTLAMDMPLGDVQSITSIKYIDVDGVEQTWDSSEYNLDLDTSPERIYLTYDKYWPETQDIENAVAVRFVAGYGDTASEVPAAIRQAALMLIGTMYCNRETARGMRMHEMPFAAKHLLAPFKHGRY